MRKLGKKGVTEDMLLQVIKILFAVTTIIIIIYASVRLTSTFVMKEKTQAEIDFERIVAEIPEMLMSDKIGIPIQGKEYNIKLIDKDNPDLPSKCKDQACACLYLKQDSPKVCEPFYKFESSRNPDKCKKDSLCIKTSEIEVQENQSIVTLVSSNYIIEIS